MVTPTPSATRIPTETANDVFKRRFADRFWGSLIAATVIHFALFAFWPRLSTADVRSGTVETIMIAPPEVVIPPPPEEIARPATPVIGSADIPDDITTPRIDPGTHRLEELPRPPARVADDLAGAPRFVPFTIAPELRNRTEISRLLERSYPPVLREAGIGGSPTVWFFIDETGRVLRTELHQSSGYEQLDRAAMEVAGAMRFSPAVHRDRAVPVWVSIPIVFRAR